MSQPGGKILSVLLYLGVAACAPAPAREPVAALPQPQAPPAPPAPDGDVATQRSAQLAALTGAFDEFGYSGCFAMRSAGRDTLVHPETCRVGFLPASTFKIPNSLFALELGVVSGPEHVYKWDGTDRGIPAWNQDHTLLTAFQYSAVWYYQQVAREIGQARMQRAVDSIQYGNQRIGPVLDEFWLVGDMRVTPLQQLDLLERLYTESLPFSQQTQRAVKRMLRSIDYPELPIYAKTGRTQQRGLGDVGWYVGYVDAPGGPHYFATLLTRPSLGAATAAADTFNDDRKRVTLSLLRKAGTLADSPR